MNYIKVLSAFDNMMIKGCYTRNKICSRDVKILDLMICEEKSEKLIKNCSSKISSYILKLWHFYLKNQKNIKINLYLMDIERIMSVSYGYKLFSPLVYTENDELINFSLFISLFKNLRTFTIFSHFGCQLSSIKLNLLFLDLMLKTITLINKSSSSNFKEFIIANPHNLHIFIKNNKEKFIKKGWKLNKIKYHNDEWNEDFNDSLSIKR